MLVGDPEVDAGPDASVDDLLDAWENPVKLRVVSRLMLRWFQLNPTLSVPKKSPDVSAIALLTHARPDG